jgi:hypothetical protein
LKGGLFARRADSVGVNRDEVAFLDVATRKRIIPEEFSPRL